MQFFSSNELKFIAVLVGAPHKINAACLPTLLSLKGNVGNSIKSLSQNKRFMLDEIA